MKKEDAERTVKDLENLGFYTRIDKDVNIDNWVARVYLGRHLDISKM